MIQKLTPEQEALIPKYIQKYRDIVKGDTDREKQDEAVIALYELAGEKKPIILHFTSPFLCVVADKILDLIWDNLDSELYSNLYSQLYSHLSRHLESQLSSQLPSKLDFQLYSQLRSELESKLSSQLRSELESKLSSQLPSELDSQLSSQLYSELDSKIKSRIFSRLYSYLGFHLSSKLSSQLKNANKDTYFWLVFWWNSWLGYYKYAQEIGVQFDQEKLDKFELIVSNLHCIIPYRGLCIVSDKPTEITWNNAGMLHNEEGMSVRYSDGTGIYSLNGVSFSGDMYHKIVNKKLSFKEIMEIKDIDKKAIAMKYMPAKVFLKEAKAELVCKKTKRGNELWKIPKGNVDIFDQDEYFLHYFCSSSGREYLEAVEPSKAVECNFNADYLMALRHKFTLEQYLDEFFTSA